MPLHWVASANGNPPALVRRARCAHRSWAEAMFACFCSLQKSMLSICSDSLQSGLGPVDIKSLPIAASHRGSELTAAEQRAEPTLDLSHSGFSLVQIWLWPVLLMWLWVQARCLALPSTASLSQRGQQAEGREGRRSQESVSGFTSLVWRI